MILGELSQWWKEKYVYSLTVSSINVIKTHKVVYVQITWNSKWDSIVTNGTNGGGKGETNRGETMLNIKYIYWVGMRKIDTELQSPVA